MQNILREFSIPSNCCIIISVLKMNQGILDGGFIRNTEAYLELSQTSKVEFFAKTDVSLVSESTAEIHNANVNSFVSMLFWNISIVRKLGQSFFH